MSTALAVRKAEVTEQNPTGIGGDKEIIASVQKRIMQMIPGAQAAPASVVWAVAQIATALDLNPLIGEVYIANIKGTWGPIIATMGYETLARRIAKFDYKYTPMTEAELKAHRGADYHVEDYGVKITLRRWDEMKEAKAYGIDYWPVETYGIWRKKGQGGAPDNIHNTWTKIQMAEYRALRTALKRAFSLGHAEAVEQQFGAFDGEFDIEVAATLQEHIESMDRDAAPVNGNGLRPDDDMLFAGEPDRTPRAPIESEEIDEIYDAIVEADETPEDEPADEAPELAAPGQVKAIVSLCHAKHGDEADEFMAAICNDHGVNMIDQLTSKQAGVIIATLNRLPDVKRAKQPA